jgi:hypothetical protein
MDRNVMEKQLRHAAKKKSWRRRKTTAVWRIRIWRVVVRIGRSLDDLQKVEVIDEQCRFQIDYYGEIFGDIRYGCIQFQTVSSFELCLACSQMS